MRDIWAPGVGVPIASIPGIGSDGAICESVGSGPGDPTFAPSRTRRTRPPGTKYWRVLLGTAGYWGVLEERRKYRRGVESTREYQTRIAEGWKKRRLEPAKTG